MILTKKETSMASWEFTKKGQEPSGADAVTIFGVPVSSAQAKAAYSGTISRHHLIDMQQLKLFWNTIVKREDDDTMEALAIWAGSQHMLPARPFKMQTTNPPPYLLKS